MKKIINKYFRPTSKKWRIIGDTLLVLAASITALNFIDPTLQDWRTIFIVVFLIAGKFLTNLNIKK